MLFAHLKRILRLGRTLRLRGPTGAKDEFLISRHRLKSQETGRSFIPHPAPIFRHDIRRRARIPPP